ncbi:GTP cyclohydrolase 1 type 2/Nif3 [Gorgonomyces haynaldii]|nr:GTP cyclohydrolase 1 type 2/Nif3 [Gorgonomyces haynaldii]
MPNLLQRVIKSMETIAPISLSESAWDNTGLLIEAPFPRPMASKVLLTIDLDQHVLDEAISDPQVGVIVSYHPPIFRPFKRLTMEDKTQKLALKCIASGISVYSPHTALDNCVGGINDWLARGLGPGRTVAINPISNPPQAQEGSGSGRMHVLDHPISLQVLVQQVKKYLGLKHVRVAKTQAHATKLITSIAICAGSGGSVLDNVQADVYLTGEMTHHTVLKAVASETSVILTEHTNSERGYLSNVLQPRLLSLLKVDLGLDVESDINVDVICSKLDKDPIEIE